MYSKQEASLLRQEFWTAFGHYVSPVLSAEGEKINWINYKTGEKSIGFRMNADGKKASISIELTHKDEEIQALYFSQFEQLKPLLDKALQEDWNWQLLAKNDQGKMISSIYKDLNEVSISKKEDWVKLISFFKPRMIALDEFWSTAKYSFEAMR